MMDRGESADNEQEPRKMDVETTGRLLLFVGLGITALGGVMLLISRVPGLNRLFNLPGDISIQTENVSCFFPIVSMIVISVILTVVVNVVIRLLNK